jgi:hypothetical protein
MKRPRKSLFPRQHDYIAGLNGIANGKTATLKVPGNYRYHGLTLRTTIDGDPADPIDVIENIKIFAGPRQVQVFEATPTQLIGEAKMAGIIPGASECPIDFTDPTKRPEIGEITSWDLYGQGDMTVKITFLDPAGGDVDCKVLAEFDTKRNVGPDGQPRLVIMKRVNVSENLPAGSRDITDIDLSWPLTRLYLTPSTGSISEVLITADGRPIMQRTKDENADELNKYGWDATQFEFPILFNKDKKLSSVLRPRNMSLRLTCSAANTTTVHAIYRVNGFK